MGNEAPTAGHLRTGDLGAAVALSMVGPVPRPIPDRRGLSQAAKCLDAAFDVLCFHPVLTYSMHDIGDMLNVSDTQTNKRGVAVEPKQELQAFRNAVLADFI